MAKKLNSSSNHNATNHTNQSALRRKSVMDLSVTVRIRTENKNNDFCYLLDFSMFFNDSSLCI